MCGILGLIGHVEEKKFSDALELMSRRGPDDSACFHSDLFHLGFNRLSIIDLDPKASQPMFSNDRRFGILFNGEIYNFKQIKAKLTKLGSEFKTKGDTEVILEAYRKWGNETFRKLNGMFSVAIFDFKKRETILARDRLGIKPLYYHKTDQYFSFSSEIKSLVHLSDKQFSLNLDSLCSYLSFRYPISGESMFSDIFSFPAGHWMKIKDGKISEKKRYWNLSKHVEADEQSNPRELIAKVRAILEDSVKRRMISDVPIGAYLSGGVDSSAVVSIMANNLDEPLNTYTIGFEDEGYNEFQYSRIVSERYGTNHTEICLDSEKYLQTMRELIRIRDSPLGVPNEVPLYLMSKRLKEDITVVLSGEGADEIFGGYGRIFRSSEDVRLINDWKNRGFSLDSELDLKLNDRYGKDFDSEIEMFLHLYSYTSQEVLKSLFDENIIDEFNRGPTIDKFKQVFLEIDDKDFMTKMMYTFEILHLPGLLQRLDSTTMGASVEGRVPFVDHELVEFAFKIPNSLKMKWISDTPSETLGVDSSEVYDTTKWILKQACSDLLPNEIIHRKKVGFPVPLEKWFGTGPLGDLRSGLIQGRLVKSGLISADRMSSFLDNEEKEGLNPMLIWMLLNIEIFLEENPKLKIKLGDI